MDDRTFNQLVRSVSRELREEGRGHGWRDDASPGGFYLVDNWRVQSTQREEFLEFYTTHVADVIREIDGFREARVLVAPVESSYSWHVQALYEFDSEDVLARFRESFDRIGRRKHRGMDMARVLEHMKDWVLAHEDGTLLEIHR